MARASNQKLKILYLARFLMQQTDEEHTASVPRMIEYLHSVGIDAERKSLYDDLEELKIFGIDINKTTTGYYVGARDFELPELKLLADSVQSSKFITEKKTLELIRKIESLASLYEAQLLQRQVYIAGRIKRDNESVYYNVDAISSGISQNRKITFRYFEYDIQKNKVFRHDGAFYKVSPYALTWDDENYYLIAYDSDTKMIRHYRADKCAEISVIDEERDGKDAFAGISMATYSKKVFGMFTGKEAQVKMRFENHLIGPVLDRFGLDTMIIPDGKEHITVSVGIVVSPQFYAWISAFGTAAEIISPKEVVHGMQQHVEAIAEMYERKRK
jgi:hypothetical protein